MMSRELGLAVLRNDYHGERIPVMEHPRGLSRQAIAHFSGIDPLAQPHRLNEAFQHVAQAFEIDLVWGGGLPGDVADPRSALGGTELFDWSDGQTVKRTRSGMEVVQWGIFGAVHQEDGRHFVEIPKPAGVDEALEFQPLDWFPDTVEQYQQRFEREHAAMLNSCGDTCVPIPHHYTTAFHFPLAIFGFELLCEAGMEEEPFSRLVERFAEVSLRVTTAWSRVSGVAGFICHDDLTMTSGPIFPPQWYRRHIFPHYREIFRPLRDRGIPIIFTSDGDCSVFVDDIFAAGADGLNFEYLVDLERLVRDHPDKLLIGNINSGTIARGPAARIRDEVLRCTEIGRRARRFVLNVGGGLTHDMPVEHLEEYLRVSRPALHRSTTAPRQVH
jgi:hypothetical protein